MARALAAAVLLIAIASNSAIAITLDSTFSIADRGVTTLHRVGGQLDEYTDEPLGLSPLTVSGTVDTQSLEVVNLVVQSSAIDIALSTQRILSRNLGPVTYTVVVDPPGFDPPVTTVYDLGILSAAISVTSVLVTRPAISISAASVPIDPFSLAAVAPGMPTPLGQIQMDGAVSMSLGGSLLDQQNWSVQGLWGVSVTGIQCVDVPAPGCQVATTPREPGSVRFESSFTPVTIADVQAILGAQFVPGGSIDQPTLPRVTARFAVPEPAVALLLPSGLVGLAWTRRRRLQ